jgi:hypothetical protein
MKGDIGYPYGVRHVDIQALERVRGAVRDLHRTLDGDGFVTYREPPPSEEPQAAYERARFAQRAQERLGTPDASLATEGAHLYVGDDDHAEPWIDRGGRDTRESGDGSKKDAGTRHSYYEANKDLWRNPDGSWRDTYADDPERRREVQRQYYARNREAVLARRRAARAEARRTGRCPICQDDGPLVRDHCHVTGRNRAWICNGCNLMLGHARDLPGVLAAGAAYLLGFGEGDK